MLIKVRLLVKILLKKIVLKLKVTTDKVKTKKLCFGFFCRFMTSALTLSREIRMFAFFKQCSVFAIFKPLPVDFGRKESVYFLLH